jgi:hypothetical protein
MNKARNLSTSLFFFFFLISFLETRLNVYMYLEDLEERFLAYHIIIANNKRKAKTLTT